MPTCNDYKDLKGCGQEVQWIPNPQKPGKKMKANLDGSKHECTGGSSELSGLEQAQVHSKAEKYMGDLASSALTQPLENIHKILLNIESQNTSINTNQMNILSEFRDYKVNVTDILKGLKIKGKTDYSKDDKVSSLEDKIDQIQKDIVALSENFVIYGDLNKAALEKGGMISAAELYKQKQQTEQIKLDK